VSGAATKFDDLKTRILSAIVILLIAGFAIWAGGTIFLVAIAAAVGLMIWELASMLAPGRDRLSLILAGIGALVVFGWHWAPSNLGLALVFAPALLSVGLLKTDRRVFALYSVMICVAGIGFYSLRADYGLVWIIWLALVVIASDVMGYFAGRLIGGPKFWPKVSPKKTWSGTVAGWFGAIIVALFFIRLTDSMSELIVISVMLAIAAQMGDIAESAIKRKAGVKDSSALIPGHGGLLDRFDGMLGASVILILIQQVIDFPLLPGVS
jgi:phosphatidate cytidylyltransferase